MHFFISHLARWLRTRRFSDPTFRPPRATNHWKWKNTVFREFPTFSDATSTKHTSVGPLLEVPMSKKCKSQNVLTLHVSATFGGSDVEKVHAVVARSTFRSENVQNTTCSRHFWRFRCRKNARRCGAQHISK